MSSGSQANQTIKKKNATSKKEYENWMNKIKKKLFVEIVGGIYLNF